MFFFEKSNREDIKVIDIIISRNYIKPIVLGYEHFINKTNKEEKLSKKFAVILILLAGFAAMMFVGCANQASTDAMKQDVETLKAKVGDLDTKVATIEGKIATEERQDAIEDSIEAANAKPEAAKAVKPAGKTGTKPTDTGAKPVKGARVK